MRSRRRPSCARINGGWLSSGSSASAPARKTASAPGSARSGRKTRTPGTCPPGACRNRISHSVSSRTSCPLTASAAQASPSRKRCNASCGVTGWELVSLHSAEDEAKRTQRTECLVGESTGGCDGASMPTDRWAQGPKAYGDIMITALAYDKRMTASPRHVRARCCGACASRASWRRTGQLAAGLAHHAVRRQTRMTDLCPGTCRAKVHHETCRPVP